MTAIRPVRRVITVVLDGLRADAIHAFGLGRIARLMERGAATLRGTTIDPSVTAACMASLLTGAPPTVHGVRGARFHVPRRRGPVDPLPRVLAEAGFPSSAFMCQVPFLMRGIARQIARHLGLANARLEGREAREVLAAARDALANQRDGLILLHWPDCDDAGHDHGWMSAPYARAAQRLDAAFGALVDQVDLGPASQTMLVALADHGGGGTVPNDHDSPHPLDRTIPMVFAGAGIIPGALRDQAHLLDVPATILHVLGVRVPETYVGRPLTEAFERAALAG